MKSHAVIAFLDFVFHLEKARLMTTQNETNCNEKSKHPAVQEIMDVAPVGSYCINIDGQVFEVSEYKEPERGPSNTRVVVTLGVGGSYGNQLTWSLRDFVKFYRPISPQTAHKVMSQGERGTEAFKSAPRLNIDLRLVEDAPTTDPYMDIQAYKDQIESLELCLAESRKSHDKVQEEYDELFEEKDDLQDRIAELEDTVYDLEQELEEERENKCIRVEHNYKDLILELDMYRRRCDRQRNEIYDLNNQKENLRLEILDSLEHIHNRNGRSASDTNKQEDRIAALEAELEQERQNHEKLMAHNKILIEQDLRNHNELMTYSQLLAESGPMVQPVSFAEQVPVQIPDQSDGDFSDEVHHPSHYTSDPSGVECNTIRENWCSNLADTLKYIWRHGKKPGENAVKDLEKAKKYIDFEIERIKRNQ